MLTSHQDRIAVVTGAAILFLTSQDSYVVTGQTIMADGGLVRM
jgi:hypothetical protein